MTPSGTPLNDRSRMQRWYLTPGGIGRFADLEAVTLDDVLRSFPLSAEWRRWLLRRMETVAICYRVALDASLPYEGRLSWRWQRSGPVDAFMTLPDGRTLGVVRFGPALPRRSMYSRLGKPSGDAPAQHTVRGAARCSRANRATRIPGADERRDAGSFVRRGRRSAHHALWRCLWRSHSYRPDTAFPLGGVIKAVVRRPLPSAPPPPKRVSMPKGLVGDEEDQLDLISCNLVQPAGRMLDVLADWPLMRISDMSEFLGISVERVKPAGRSSQAPG